jgi:predicted SprT family Zn-dependent metalloprotease
MKLKTIVNLYDELNRANFAGRLERPTILLTKRWVHGDYAYGGNSDRVVMRFNPADDKGLRQMRATVFHEMVHQFVHQVLGEHTDKHDDLFWLCYFRFATPNFNFEDPKKYDDE